MSPALLKGHNMRKRKGHGRRHLTTEGILNRLEVLTRKDGARLNKLVAAFKYDLDGYRTFVNRVDQWYSKNEKRFLRYMSMYGRDTLSEAEFKLALISLQAPFNELERHVLYLLMDAENTGKVEYPKFYEALWQALASRIMLEDEFKKMDISPLNLWIQMTFKVPSCEPFDMPTTFEETIELTCTGTYLRQLIRSRVPILCSRNLILFTDPSKYADTIIHCNQKLIEFKYVGGPKCAPPEGMLFYEFSMGRIDCPLILSNRPLVREEAKQVEQIEDADQLIY